MKKRIVFFSLILFLSFSAPLCAEVRVSPTITQLYLASGEEKSDFFSVYNSGGKQISVEAQAEELLKSSEDSKSIDINAWLEVEPEKFDIGPGETKSIKYNVKIPKGQRGELRGQIFFATDTDFAGGIGIKNRFGVAVYVAIKGTEVVKAKIAEVAVSKATSKEAIKDEGADNKNIKFSVIVQNKGNVHIRPKGKLLVKNREGSIVKELILPYGYPIMPNAGHAYDVIWEETGLVKGKYKIIASIQYGDIYQLNKNYETQAFFSVK